MKRLRAVRAALLLSLLPALAGVFLVRWPPTAGLENAGLDLLFQWRGELDAPPDVVVAAIDLDSYDVLDVDHREAWPREFHAQLIETLAAEGARAIAFDVIFQDEGDPAQDMPLVWALEDTGIVVLGATVDQIDDPRFRRARLIEPWKPFSEAAARLGEVNLPPDRDDAIRSAFLEPNGRPGLALAAYEVATGDMSKRGQGVRLIDYYGPARTVRTVSIYQALEPDEYLPEGFFENKIVFVGLSEKTATGIAAKDAFPTPFTGARGQTTYGVEIHATLAANLLDDRRIDLLPTWLEVVLLLLLPLLALLLFATLGPVWGLVALLSLTTAPWIVAHVAFDRAGLWLPTVIPTAVQLPLAYTLSVIWYYLTTVRERERVKRAFSRYLSPASARKIAEDPSALKLGGEQVVGSAMFTDIAGFTPIAENMSPEETASMLNDYFSKVTTSVFDSQGTLVKYIGDAVFAIWGAPVRQDDHAVRACRAAVAISKLHSDEDADPSDPLSLLKTRIGVHTGPMLVGNLGSSQRFDYTAIGDTINLSARIEGLNKMFGTVAIVSEHALEAAGVGFVARRLGQVRVVGRADAVGLFEILGEGEEDASAWRPLIDAFEQALGAFERGSFEEAEVRFRSIADSTSDGPSIFFARECKRLQREPPERSWDGVIEARSK